MAMEYNRRCMTAHPRCRRTQPIERVSIRYYPRLGGCCPTINDNCANLLPYSWRWPMIMLSHVRWRTKQICPLGTFTPAGGGNPFSHITGVHSLLQVRRFNWHAGCSLGLPQKGTATLHDCYYLQSVCSPKVPSLCLCSFISDSPSNRGFVDVDVD